MGTFGKSLGGGRRAAKRSPAPFLAVLSTVGHDYHVALEDLSRGGARFAGPLLPSEGEDVIFTAEGIRMFGRVIWSDVRRCGVRFDPQISEHVVEQLRAESHLEHLSADERAAAEAWERGISR